MRQAPKSKYSGILLWWFTRCLKVI